MKTLALCAQFGLHLAFMTAVGLLLARRLSSPRKRVSVYRAAIVAGFVTFLVSQASGVSQWTVRLPSTPVAAPTPAGPPGGQGPRIVITRGNRPAPTVPVWGWILTGTWVAGAVWQSARIARAAVSYRRRWRGATRVSDRTLQRYVAELSRQSGLSGQVELWSVPGLMVPMVDWSGKIGLPPHVMRVLDDAAMRAVVAHEMAHVASHDAKWRVISAALTTICWWIPGLSRLTTAMQTDAEFVADAWSCAWTRDPWALARALAEAANWEDGSSMAAAATGDGRPHVLVARIERLLAGRIETRPRRGWVLAAVAGAAIVGALWVPRVLPATTSALSFPTADGGRVTLVLPPAGE